MLFNRPYCNVNSGRSSNQPSWRLPSAFSLTMENCEVRSLTANGQPLRLHSTTALIMKKSFVVIIASLFCTAAFAQGRVNFLTDTLHLVYWGPTAGTFFGQAVNSDNAPPGLAGLAVDLYLGTSSSQMYLYSSTTFRPLSPFPGTWNPLNVQANANAATGAPAIPAGTTVFVEVQVRDTSAPAPNIFTGLPDAFQAYGTSSLFNYTLSSLIAPPGLGNQTVGNWPLGTFNMDQYGTGSLGAIQVNLIPEPTTAALAGLGAAAVLICRRRR
jgi:PEP-CTERM motif